MPQFGVHLNALRAFEAAGRLSSFSRAGDELRVSHSTISHHVRGLEESLGVELFERRDRKVVLTAAGADLLPTLTRSFNAIADSLNTLRSDGPDDAVRVTVTPSFASKWLMPKLGRFHSGNSEIDVQLTSSLALDDFAGGKFNVGIRAGNGRWRGFKSEMLMPIRMTPLCSPVLLSDDLSLDNPDSLRDYTLLHADVGEGSIVQSEWSEWLKQIGASDIDCSGGLSFHDPGLALQAAIDGLGIAIGYLELARDDILAGRLVQPFEATITHPWSYYLITPSNQRSSREVQLFCQWLRSEVVAAE